MTHSTWGNALHTIHAVLRGREWGIATAESLTAGLIASTLARQSGASSYLRGSIVAYNLEAKVKLLSVNADIARACDCVSQEVATQMAQGARSQFGGCECVIAVTGYAERPSRAFYTILCGDKVREGVVEGGTASRNEVRDLVMSKTLCLLADMLETR